MEEELSTLGVTKRVEEDGKEWEPPKLEARWRSAGHLTRMWVDSLRNVSADDSASRGVPFSHLKKDVLNPNLMTSALSLVVVVVAAAVPLPDEIVALVAALWKTFFVCSRTLVCSHLKMLYQVKLKFFVHFPFVVHDSINRSNHSER